MNINEHIEYLLDFLDILLDLKESGKYYFGTIERTVIKLDKLLNS
jgi:hypothetical protein